MKCALKLHIYFSVHLPRKVGKCSHFLFFFFWPDSQGSVTCIYIASPFSVLLGVCGPWICVFCCEPVDTIFPHKLLWQPISVLSRGCVCCFCITCWNLFPAGPSSHKQYFGNKNYVFSLCTTLNFVLTLLTVSLPLPYWGVVRFVFCTIFNIVHSKTWTPDTLILLLILIYTVWFFCMDSRDEGRHTDGTHLF